MSSQPQQQQQQQQQQALGDGSDSGPPAQAMSVSVGSPKMSYREPIRSYIHASLREQLGIFGAH